MLDCDDYQHDAPSPMDVRDRRIAALQTEPNAPLMGFSPVVEDTQQCELPSVSDMTSVILATRAATERRLKLQSTQLRRFHQQICVRVNERALQQRATAQSHAKRVDKKLARLLQLPSTGAASNAGDGELRSPIPAATVAAPRNLSRTSTVETLIRHKQQQLTGHDAASTLVEKALRSDAQAREWLLTSTRVARVRGTRGCEQLISSDNQVEDDDGDDGTHDVAAAGGRHGSGASVDLPNKQRLEVYAAVRRRYMALGRERTQQKQQQQKQQQGGRGTCSGGTHKPLTATSMRKATRRTATPCAHAQGPRPDVFTVDASSGCEISLERQCGKASSTPWRKSAAGTPSPPSSRVSLSAGKTTRGSPPTATATRAGPSPVSGVTPRERFLSALQTQLGTPALCACGTGPCANNCAFYGQKQKKERFATSVCQQHQQHQQQQS